MLDQSFKEWVLHSRNALTAFWELWVADHPEKHEEIHEAREIILILNNLFRPETSEQFDSRWLEICN